MPLHFPLDLSAFLPAQALAGGAGAPRTRGRRHAARRVPRDRRRSCDRPAGRSARGQRCRGRDRGAESGRPHQPRCRAALGPQPARRGPLPRLPGRPPPYRDRLFVAGARRPARHPGRSPRRCRRRPTAGSTACAASMRPAMCRPAPRPPRWSCACRRCRPDRCRCALRASRRMRRRRCACACRADDTLEPSCCCSTRRRSAPDRSTSARSTACRTGPTCCPTGGLWLREPDGDLLSPSARALDDPAVIVEPDGTRELVLDRARRARCAHARLAGDADTRRHPVAARRALHGDRAV